MDNNQDSKDNIEQNQSQHTVPQAVKDVDSYKKYIELKNLPNLQLPNRLIHTSDVNITIDPQAHNAKIHKDIKHFDVDEKDDIERRVRAYKVLKGRVNSLREKAYGLKKRSHHPTLMMPLLDERKSELLEYFGKMLDDKDVHKIINNEWGYEVSVRTVTLFRRAHLDQIKKLQADFQKDFTSVRLSHKRARIEELQKIFNKRKVLYETNPTLGNERSLLMALKEIREETRDDTIKIQANIENNINITINHHIQSEIMQGMTINDIILARAAAKMKVNPAFLIARLHESLYSKFNGFAQPDDQKPIYPSTMVYNWDKIEKQHKDQGDAGKEYAEYQELPQQQKDEASDIKSIIASKIKQKKQDANSAEYRVDKNTQ